MVVAIAIVALAAALDGQSIDNFRIPGAQSQQALDLLEPRFPQQSGDNATVVFRRAERDVETSAAEAGIEASVTALEKIPHVSRRSWDRSAATDGSDIALVTLQYDEQAQHLGVEAFDDIERATAPAAQRRRADGVRRAAGRLRRQPPVSTASTSSACSPRSSSCSSRSARCVAMGLPILTALLGLGVGLSRITLLAAVTDIGTPHPCSPR